MTALVERHVLTGAVGRVVRGMTVTRGHRMPEGTPCRPEAEIVAVRMHAMVMAISRDSCTMGTRFETYEGAMAS